MRTAPHPSAAFTLIELLVVITIVAILAGMLLPAVSLVRDLAKQVTCLSNQRQFMLATIAYANDNEGLTPSIDAAGMTSGNRPPRNPHLSLMYGGYLPVEYVKTNLPPATGDWNWADLRWPNPMQCPSVRPDRYNNQKTAYGYRWTTTAAAYTAAKQPSTEVRVAGNGDSFLVGSISQVIPFQAEAHNKPSFDSTTLYSGMSWHSDASAPVAGWAEGRVRLTHRGKAVVTWIDGRSVARNRSQLEGEDGILGPQQMP